MSLSRRWAYIPNSKRVMTDRSGCREAVPENLADPGHTAQERALYAKTNGKAERSIQTMLREWSELDYIGAGKW